MFKMHLVSTTEPWMNLRLGHFLFWLFNYKRLQTSKFHRVPSGFYFQIQVVHIRQSRVWLWRGKKYDHLDSGRVERVRSWLAARAPVRASDGLTRNRIGSETERASLIPSLRKQNWDAGYHKGNFVWRWWRHDITCNGKFSWKKQLYINSKPIY